LLTPVLERGGPTCTVQDCAFEIWILPQPQRAAFQYRASFTVLLDILVNSGLRPWVVYSHFEIKGGKLKESRTATGHLRNATLGDFKGQVSLEYEVYSTAHPEHGDPDYLVIAPHVTGPPTESLYTRFAQASKAPRERAFDANLRCFTTIWRGCSGLSELAPSAWADHQSELAKQ
jgi:hypothetical protein